MAVSGSELDCRVQNKNSEVRKAHMLCKKATSPIGKERREAFHMCADSVMNLRLRKSTAQNNK